MNEFKSQLWAADRATKRLLVLPAKGTADASFEDPKGRLLRAAGDVDLVVRRLRYHGHRVQVAES